MQPQKNISANIHDNDVIAGNSTQRGAEGKAATIEIGTVSTGAAGTDATVVNVGTENAAILDFVIPRGENGTNATITDVFASVSNTIGTPAVSVYVGGTETERTFGFDFYNLKGDKGETGSIGTSVTGVTLISTVGLDNTYRMAFSDSNYFDYTVKDGATEGASWGNITGTLADQTDLNTELGGLQSQIDAITSASDVTDIVGTYAELQAYDTTSLPNNSIIKVLQDEDRNNETTYYKRKLLF